MKLDIVNRITREDTMRSITKTSAAALAATTMLVGAASAQELSGELRIISDMSNPGPRAVMEQMAADFDALHPDLTVDLTIVDREAWKTQIRNALSADPPDVVNWYAANRMAPFVDAGLFMDITDWWEAGDYEGLDSVRGAMTQDDRQWGIPYTYYQWGMYYREDIFNELGLSEPATWEEEIANCQVIVDSGRKPATPSAPGSFGPPAAGSTISTCAPTGSTFTWRLPVVRSSGPMTVCGKPSPTGVS
jgi:multiple sugar transport system substrate-binding protein